MGTESTNNNQAQAQAQGAEEAAKAAETKAQDSTERSDEAQAGDAGADDATEWDPASILSDMDMFGDDATAFPSDDELRGEPVEPAKDNESAAKPEETEPEGDKDAETPPAGGDKGTKGEDDKDGDKPPKGYVPQQALDEERHKRRELQDEIRSIREEFEALKASRPPKAQEGDKGGQEGPGVAEIPEAIREDVEQFVKDNPEHKDLVYEDSPEGARLRRRIEADGPEYANETADLIALRRERQREKEEAEKAKAEKTKTEFAKRVEQARDTAYAELRANVPDLFDQGGAVKADLARSLVDFAVEHGWGTRGAFQVLSDPMTLVTVKGRDGQEQQVPLGTAATDLVTLLHNLKTRTEGKKPGEITEQDVPEAVRKAIEQKAVTAAMAKIKKPGTDEFSSYGDAPRSGGDMPLPSGEEPTQDDFLKMTREQEEFYLRGGDLSGPA